MDILAKRHFSIVDFLEGKLELYSPPEIYLKITEVLDSPTADVADIARVVEQDPALVARMLKIVNSAFYGFPGRVDSISKAITMLGINEVRMLVMATSVIERFSSFPNGLISMRDFWSHSLRTALFAKFLAEQHPKKRQLSTAFMSGLLHDIGRIILYDKAPDLSRAAVLQAKADDVPDYEAETAIFGFNHADVGGGLVDLWKLPKVFGTTAKYHHNPHDAEDFQLECSLIYLANCIANVDVLDSEVMMDMLPPEDPAWETVALPYGILDEVIRQVDEQFSVTFTQLFG